jgi:ArsR family transcriptional regulator
MRELMAITKALADQHRVRMLLALRHQELCVCQMIELFGLAPSTVSKHLSILRAAGLVEGRKRGRWMYCRWPSEDAPVVVSEAIDWMQKSLAGDSRVAEDAARLRRVLKMDPEDICKRLGRR